MRITHVITDLRTGGAQVMLRRLVTRLRADGVHSTVISLGTVSPEFQTLGETAGALHELRMAPNVPSVAAFVRLRRLIALSRPDVVHTWMYHADFMGGLAAVRPRRAPVVWALHHTLGASRQLKPVTRAIVRVNSRLSSFVPDRIVCCGHACMASHAALGYAAGKMTVIANGFDTDAFRPEPAARGSVRQELGLPDDTPLVGLMARFHPQKAHRTFVHAAASAIRLAPRTHFVLAGLGVDRGNRDLGSWIDATGSADRSHLLGNRTDMPRLIAACDIVSTSSAYGEGLPLVIGEAMACAVPCVATDVGDSALLVGTTGRVVAPGDPEALGAAWVSLLGLTGDERRRLGELARERVVSVYSLHECVRAYQALYQELRPPVNPRHARYEQ